MQNGNRGKIVDEIPFKSVAEADNKCCRKVSCNAVKVMVGEDTKPWRPAVAGVMVGEDTKPWIKRTPNHGFKN